MGMQYAVTFNSGTSALHALLLAYGIKGKEVIVPSFTFISTISAVILAGGIPVFAEIEPDTFGLDALDVQKKISKNTSAIVLVHYGGFPARDTLAIKKIADEHQIFLFEDNAESMGASIGGKKVGTFGDAGVLSFCQNKIITTGEGGALITNNKNIYEKAKLIRSHGRIETSEDYFASVGDMDYVEVGYNYRMSSITAGLGIAQLKKVNKLIELRRKVASIYDSALDPINQISLPKKIPTHFEVYQMYPLLLPDENIRNNLQQHLAARGIMTKIYFYPAHLKTIFLRDYGLKEGHLPKTEMLSKKILSLPIYPHILKEDLQYIIAAINDFFS